MDVEPITDQIVEGELKLFGYVSRTKEARTTKNIYETKLQGRTKRKAQEFLITGNQRRKEGL